MEMNEQTVKDYKQGDATKIRYTTLTQDDVQSIMSKLGPYKEMTALECQELSLKRMGDRKISDVIREEREAGWWQIVAYPKFYLDTSVLVKRYWSESGSDFLNELYGFELRRNSKLFTAKHTLSEFASAAMRIKREGQFSEEEANSYVNSFLLESGYMISFIDLNDDMYYNSIDLLKQYTLKAADSLHLSAAIDLRFGSVLI